MSNGNKIWLSMWTAMVVCAALSGNSFGQMIRLQAKATVEAKQDVRLGDIAIVSGGDRKTVEELSGTVILSAVEGPRKIKAELVLMSLMSQRGGKALGGNLQISGASECEVIVADKSASPMTIDHQIAALPTLLGGRAEPAPLPAAPSAEARSAAAVQPISAAASDQNTLSKQIVARVLRDLALPAEDVRVTFETINPFLDHPVAAGRKWLCRPLTRLPLGTVQFEAQLVEGAKVIERLNVQTKVERRQRVVVTTARLDRGDVVTAAHLHLEDAWLDRNLPTLLLSDKGLVGLEAQRALEIGSMADQRDFKPAMMATKNDVVTVVYVAGTLQVKMRGRAMADGKLHDQVTVRNEATGERYQAVMIAKGLAVVGGTLTEAEEKKLISGR